MMSIPEWALVFWTVGSTLIYPTDYKFKVGVYSEY